MPEEKSVGVHQPHDRFFKCLLEEGLMVRDLLERYLPSEILTHIDLQYLEPVPTEGFLESKLLVDVVWQSRMRTSGKPIFILLEHQSTFDSKMAHRLRRYMWMLSDRVPDALTPVVALVFYHGMQKNVPAVIDVSNDRHSPISAPGIWGLAAQVPVVNYQQLTWQQIPTNRPASMLECCLKARIDPQWQYLQEAMQNLQVWGGLSPKTIAEIQRYLLHQVQMHDSPLDVFYRIIQLPTFTPEGDIHMATLAEWIANTTPEMLEQQWLQEGMQKGLQKGRQEGHIEGLQIGLEKGLEQGQLQERRHLIQRLLNHGMSIDKVAEITEFSIREIQQVLSTE